MRFFGEDKKSIDNIMFVLVGHKVCLLRKQNYFGIFEPDFIHVRFDNDVSLYITNLMRISRANSLILSSCDEMFTTDFVEINEPYFGEEINQDNNLLKVHINDALKLLKDKCVVSANINDFGDLSIEFEDDILLSAYVDVKLQGEFFRILTADEQFAFVFENGEFCCKRSENDADND